MHVVAWFPSHAPQNRCGVVRRSRHRRNTARDTRLSRAPPFPLPPLPAAPHRVVPLLHPPALYSFPLNAFPRTHSHLRNSRAASHAGRCRPRARARARPRACRPRRNCSRRSRRRSSSRREPTGTRSRKAKRPTRRRSECAVECPRRVSRRAGSLVRAAAAAAVGSGPCCGQSGLAVSADSEWSSRSIRSGNRSSRGTTLTAASGLSGRCLAEAAALLPGQSWNHPQARAALACCAALARRGNKVAPRP